MDKQLRLILRLISSRQVADASNIAFFLDKSPLQIQEQLNLLLEKEYIAKRSPQSDNQPYHLVEYVITTKGSLFLSEKITERKKHIILEFRAWVTLAIAVASLIISIIAVLQ